MTEFANIIRCATVTVRDVEAAARNYEQWFGYRLAEVGEIDAGLAQSWGAPGHAGRPYRLLQPASGAESFIRFVEGSSSPEEPPMRTLGWSAMEIAIEDVFAANEHLQDSPFAIIGPPKPMESLPTIHPMQVRAPDGELSFLTQILSREPNNGLPRPESFIDHIFIMVAGCSDADRTYAWFEEQIGIEPRMTLEMTYRLINEAFGLPLTNKIRMRTGKAKGLVCFEFDALPEGAEPRRRTGDGLPEGIGLVSVSHPDLGNVPGPWLAPPEHRPGALYGGRRSGTLSGPDGILVEVIEA